MSVASPRPLLIVTGTRREAKVLAGPDVITLAGGGDSDRLARQIDAHAGEVCGILSFGMAGALAPDLALGDWVIGTQVNGTPCDPVFANAMSSRLRSGRRFPSQGPIHASDALIPSADEKYALHAATGAIACDMESHVAAAAAGRHNLRFAVLRCISDAADTDLPPAIAVAMKPGGGLALGRILWSLVRHPLQVPSLIATTRRFGQAFKVLSSSGGRALRSVWD